MFVVNSSFIGKFKLGDNINLNCSTLRLLYSMMTGLSEPDKALLYKPITIIIVSIIEALLYDLHYRAKTFTKEGIQNVTNEVLDYIRGKHIDELEKYIASAKKHDLFDQADTDFYDALDELRRLRNRIHIQNTKNHFEADESDAFCKERLEQAEIVLEKVAKTLSVKFSRGSSFHHVEDFTFPWTEHL